MSIDQPLDKAHTQEPVSIPPINVNTLGSKHDVIGPAALSRPGTDNQKSVRTRNRIGLLDQPALICLNQGASNGHPCLSPRHPADRRIAIRPRQNNPRNRILDPLASGRNQMRIGGSRRCGMRRNRVRELAGDIR